MRRIKKVVEAKGRWKRKVTRKLNQARKKATMILESEDLGSQKRAKEIGYQSRTSFKLVQLNLVPIKLMAGCMALQEDITSDKTRSDLKKKLNTARADMVLHEGVSNVGKNWINDACQQSLLTLNSKLQGQTKEKTKLKLSLKDLRDKVTGDSNSKERAKHELNQLRSTIKKKEDECT